MIEQLISMEYSFFSEHTLKSINLQQIISKSKQIDKL